MHRRSTLDLESLEAKKAYSIQKAAELLDVSIGHLRNEFKRGKIKFVKSGRRTLITDDELRRYLQESELKAEQEA